MTSGGPEFLPQNAEAAEILEINEVDIRSFLTPHANALSLDCKRMS